MSMTRFDVVKDEDKSTGKFIYSYPELLDYEDNDLIEIESIQYRIIGRTSLYASDQIVEHLYTLIETNK